MGRLYSAYVEVGPKFTGFGDIKSQGDKAGQAYGKALAEAAVKAAKANARNLGAALAKARQSEADAAGKVRVAETQLAESRKKYGAASSQAVAAEEKLAAAQRKSAASADTTKHATEALGKAQSQVANAAADAGKRSGGRFTGAFKGALSKIGGEKEGRQVATRFGVGMNGAIGSVVSRSAGIFAAGFAAVQGARVFGGFINDASESAKVSRITANAIRATGGAANITADQVGALATSISNKTAIDDEQIQTASNMLLTFKNIRNETGQGNDIFNQATQAAADLSVQFGGMDGASKQLGKALNDPIKGTTALAKAGVTFTQQQKDQIATLVKSGDVLGAQKIILKEIQGQVGGAAAAAADPMERLKVVAGNLGESIGGLLLPTVNKFANFLTDTAVPGIQAMGAAFQGGGVTSDGFVGVMERIGVAARTAFDFFKTDILPRLKEFGTFIVGTAVPAVVKFGQNLATTFGPAIKDVFGFFKTEVLPRLKDFASFLGDKVLPKVGELATSLSKNKDFLVPFAATILAVVAGLKAWAIVQGALNVVLAANPIGLIVLAIAGLVAGLVYAYKHSEKFREIVDALAISAGLAMISIGQAVLGLVKIVAPALKFISDMFLGMVGNIIGAAAQIDNALGGHLHLQEAADGFNRFREGVSTAFDGAIAKAGDWDKTLDKAKKELVLKANIQDLETKLRTAKDELADPDLTKERRAELTATKVDLEKQIRAAKGLLADPALVKKRVAVLQADKKVLDDKLATAKRQLADPKLTATKKATLTVKIADLQRGVNAAQAKINSLKGKTVLVRYSAAGVTTWTAASTRGGGKQGGIGSAGMATGGPVRGPGGPTDDRVPIMASAGEHMWTAREVAAAGGHRVVEQMRKSVVGLAAGGPVINMRKQGVFPSVKAGQKYIDGLFGGMDGGPPGSRQRFRGQTLNARTIRMLLNAERILGAMFHITQGSYSTRVAASGGTHSGGGAMDTNGPRGWNTAVAALRKAGFAAWHRTPAQGPWSHHIHSIALGDTSASPSAKAQMASFRRGGDGLGHGMAKGGPVLMDKGGYLPVGRSMVENRTGKPEPLTRTDQLMKIDPASIRELAALLRDALTIDGRSLDTALSRSALGRGYR